MAAAIFSWMAQDAGAREISTAMVNRTLYGAGPVGLTGRWISAAQLPRPITPCWWVTVMALLIRVSFLDLVNRPALRALAPGGAKALLPSREDHPLNVSSLSISQEKAPPVSCPDSCHGDRRFPLGPGSFRRQWQKAATPVDSESVGIPAILSPGRNRSSARFHFLRASGSQKGRTQA